MKKKIEKKPEEKLEKEICFCEMEPAFPEHTCPFKEEVHNDFKTLCTCCAACQRECLMDT